MNTPTPKWIEELAAGVLGIALLAVLAIIVACAVRLIVWIVP